MTSFQKRLLIDSEFVLVGVYVLSLIAALATGEGVSRTFGIPPTFVMALGMGFGPAGYVGLALYFLLSFSLPIASVIVNRKNYLVLNICLLIAAVASTCSFVWSFLGVLFP
jgi:phage shock protein PspC (stress-responsive transcriptional regulator)